MQQRRAAVPRYQRFVVALTLAGETVGALRGCGVAEPFCSCESARPAMSDAGDAGGDSGPAYLPNHPGGCTTDELARGCRLVNQGAGPLAPPDLPHA